MSFEPTELIVDTNALPWIPMGEGSWAKILRTCPETGTWTILFKQEAGSVAPPHRHLAAADFYVIRGRIEYRGGVATTGAFARERMNAVHERTSFPEETIYLLTSYGPLAMHAPDGSIAGILDVEALQALADANRPG
jgi:anti-sigma factor ChrR (cupin superfamily)